MWRTPKKIHKDSRAFLQFAHKAGRAVVCKRDQTIFVDGDPAAYVFYIQKGNVKLSVVSAQGKEAIVGILGTGDLFGEGCVDGSAVA